MTELSQIAAYLKEHDRYLLLTHVRPDGDTIGSAGALCQALRDLGKTAYLLHNAEITRTYESFAAPYWAPDNYAPDCVISTDIASYGLFPSNAKPYENKINVAIDHHPSFEQFGDLSYVDPNAAACGEIIYALVNLLTPMTEEIAVRLYVAVSTDTGCFVYSNTTPRTHMIAGDLMNYIDVSQLNHLLFRTKSLTRLRMESHMIAHMELYDQDRVVVLCVTQAMIQDMHATSADIEELSALAAQIEGTDCGITLRELRPGTIKISLRTGPRVDATAVCALLGGGGHHRAAGATVNGTLEEVKLAVLKAVEEVVGNN